jgi:tetratricopeptide (TPR) repeat protein
MRVWIFTLLTASAVFAADEEHLALMQRSRGDFDRVQLAATPELRDVTGCIQTQASAVPVATTEEAPMLRYRKGYCTLVRATITHQPGDYTEAAGEFDKAIETWGPAQELAPKSKRAPELLPSGLRSLAAIARLEAAPDDPAVLERAQRELFAAADQISCASTLMTPSFCQTSVEMGRRWLGWMALQRDDLGEAERDFGTAAGTGWREWVLGRKAFTFANYREAVVQYRKSLDAAPKNEPSSFAERLGPPWNYSSRLIDLGAAQLLAGDAKDAIATFDAATKAQPENARVLYLRARAKELSGQIDAALADYNLASRTAYASARDLASGEAHLYRGILLYRRKDFQHAEDEFSSALNFEIAPLLRPDAVAWRHLAAVASGSCEASRQNLERSLPAASPFFPKDEARKAMAGCPTTTAESRRD